MFHNATQKVPPGLRQAQIHRIIGKNICFCRIAGTIPNRNMGMAAIAGEPFNGFWHEGGAQTVLFRHGFGHEFEKAVFIRGFQRVIEFPIHFELAIGVFMIVLIRAPAQRQHIIANFADHLIAAHHGLLIIAGFCGGIEWIADLIALWRE